MHTGQRPGNRERREGEQGYMLLGLIVAIFLILLTLGVAASDLAFTVRREREEESARRADQYVRAIRKFYLKNQTYPGSIKALENTNMVRYLRQQYKDPLTGKDYRLIIVGQNKTTVKGFFGQPLTGIAGVGLGALAGSQSTGMPGPGGAAGAAGAFGSTGAGGFGSSNAAGAANGAAGTAGAAGTTGAAGTSTPTTGFGSPLGGSGSMGPIMGVGSDAKGNSILVINDQTTYDTWEFLYDPRIEKLKAAAALNAGVGTMGVGALGQTPGAGGTNNQPGTGGFGNQPGAGAVPNNGAAPGGGTNPTGP